MGGDDSQKLVLWRGIPPSPEPGKPPVKANEHSSSGHAGYAGSRMPNVISTIRGLIEVFRPYCADFSTLNELTEFTADRSQWRRCHDLFDRIRKKTLSAERTADQLLEAQYLFEEVCAKTLYNLSGEPAPFDPDVPFKIVTNAFVLARRLNISDTEIVRAITS